MQLHMYRFYKDAVVPQVNVIRTMCWFSTLVGILFFWLFLCLEGWDLSLFVDLSKVNELCLSSFISLTSDGTPLLCFWIHAKPLG